MICRICRILKLLLVGPVEVNILALFNLPACIWACGLRFSVQHCLLGDLSRYKAVVISGTGPVSG
jgi:hypothetical protein